MSGSVSFVCVVESGWLDSQTVRLIESLRRHGGRIRERADLCGDPALWSAAPTGHA